MGVQLWQSGGCQTLRFLSLGSVILSMVRIAYDDIIASVSL